MKVPYYFLTVEVALLIAILAIQCLSWELSFWNLNIAPSIKLKWCSRFDLVFIPKINSIL